MCPKVTLGFHDEFRRHYHGVLAILPTKAMDRRAQVVALTQNPALPAKATDTLNVLAM